MKCPCISSEQSLSCSLQPNAERSESHSSGHSRFCELNPDSSPAKHGHSQAEVLHGTKPSLEHGGIALSSLESSRM